MDKLLAFYTVFIGSNTNPSFRVPPLPSVNHDCYYFTNNQSILKSLSKTGWIPRFVDVSPKDDVFDSCMLSKHVKALPSEYAELANYHYTCYLDSKVNKVSPQKILDLISKYCEVQGYSMLLRQHWFLPPNVFNELEESMNQERYKLQKDRYVSYITQQVENGLSSTTEYHAACGIIIRNMKDKIIQDIGETWLEHISQCGIQDQISFFFVKQLFDKKYIKVFSEIPFEK
jgi:hypothetical protein